MQSRRVIQANLSDYANKLLASGHRVEYTKIRLIKWKLGRK